MNGAGAKFFRPVFVVVMAVVFFNLWPSERHQAFADGTGSAAVGSGEARIETTSRGVKITLDDDKNGDDNDIDDDDDKNTGSGSSSDGSRHSKDRQMRVLGKWMSRAMHDRGERVEDTVVPVAFFVFLIVLILGGRYFREQTERRRLDLLRTMVDKGQPVPEAVVKQILGSERSLDPSFHGAQRVRRGTGFTIVGIGLLIYAAIESGRHQTALVLGIVFLGLGVGNLAAQRFHAGEPRQPQPPNAD